MSDDEKARAEAERRLSGGSSFAHDMREQLVQMAAWQREQDAAEIERLRARTEALEEAMSLQANHLCDVEESRYEWAERAEKAEATIERVRAVLERVDDEFYADPGTEGRLVHVDQVRAILDAR